ncbi:MAG: PLP-dependent transferase [Acidobacteria bacterium]|nr:PLP-dependent transferase [Acidobacteriota bacterium]
MSSTKKYKGFTTKAVHIGQDPDPVTGAVIPPIHATSTYIQEELGVPGEYVYSRSGNPTRRNLEANLAALENADHAVAFASGTAAIDACLRFLGPDDHVVCSEAVYGGTYRLFEQVLRRASGIDFTYVNTSDLDATEAVWTEQTRMLFIETPTNPLMQLTDIAAAADLAQRTGALLVVDNTFMSPYLQRPLNYGAHLVLHSTTKFLNGHSDSIGGVVCTNREDLATRLEFIAKSAGATLSPFEAWLIQRGVKTMALRMERSQETTKRLVAVLGDHPAVQHVYYPGLEDHPDHALAKRQMSGFGAMLSFDLADFDAAKILLDALEVMVLAESLGGVETLISHPASMTHASIPENVRRERGIGDGLVRISVGIEDADDLVADLEQALARLV